MVYLLKDMFKNSLYVYKDKNLKVSKDLLRIAQGHYGHCKNIFRFSYSNIILNSKIYEKISKNIPKI